MADICSVDMSLVASLDMLNVVVVAWFKILRASSLLVAASNLAASMPCIGGESHVLVPEFILLLLAVGAVVECCSNLLQSSLVLALPIFRIACSAMLEGLRLCTSLTPV
jgi:hypothetical protein